MDASNVCNVENNSGEYFWYNVDRNFRPGLTDVKFEGG
jgi:hypothetical protein